MSCLCVDSNAFIAYRAGDTGIRALVEDSRLIYMPVIVMGELLYGALNSSRQDENVLAVHEFFKECMPIFVDDTIAKRYADIRLTLKNNGTPIPENDIWIAASCMEVGADLLTQDNHFYKINGLTVITW